MSEVNFGIRLTSTGGQQVAGDINTSAEAINRLNTSAGKLNETQSRSAQSNEAWQRNMAGVSASIKETTAASVDLSNATQRILDRYDPLGTKLRALQSDMATLRKEMGNSSSDAAIKGFQGLESEIDKTRKLMDQAGGSTAGLGLNTQYARRELMMLGREALTGDFSQMPRTFGSLVTHSNLLPALLNPISLSIAGIAAAGAVLAYTVHQGQEETNAMNRALNMTGNISGQTVSDMHGLAASIASNSQMTVGAVKDMEVAFAASGRIGAGAFSQVMEASAAYAQATGMDADKANEHIIKMFSDPSKGAEELNRTMHHLTLSQMLYIEQLQASGDITGAQAEAARLLTEELKKHPVELGKTGQVLNEVKKSWSEYWGAAMRHFSGNETFIEQLTSLNRNIAVTSDVSQKLRLEKERDALIQQEAIKNSKAEDDAARAEINTRNQLAMSYAKVNSETYKRMELEAKLQSQKNAFAGMETGSIEAQILWDGIKATEKQITELGKLKKTRTEVHQSTMEMLQLEMSAHATATGSQLTNVEKVSLAWAKMPEKYKTAAEALRYVGAIEAAQAADAREYADAADKQYNTIQKSVDALGKAEIDTLDKTIAAQKLHNAEIGKTAEQRELAKRQIYDVVTAQMQADSDAIRSAAEYAGEFKNIYIDRANALDIEIAKRNELSGLIGSAAIAEKNAASAKEQARVANKYNEEIGRGLTDALMRGWENGKGFAANFRDTVKNMFKTLVLQPTISATMSPVSAAVSAGMGAMGIPGMANAAGMGSDLLGAIGSLFAPAATGMAAFTAAQTAGAVMSTSYVAPAIATLGAEAGTAATALGSIGSTLAAIPGWGWAIAGGLALVAMLAGNGGTPTASTGNASMSFDPTGQRTGYQTFYGGSSASTDSTITGMNAGYLSLAKGLGIGTVATNFQYGGNTGKDGKAPNFALGGGAGASQFYQAETPLTQDAVSLAASRAVFAALQGSDLPQYLKGVFSGLDASKMSGQDISNTLAFAGALKQVRTGLTETITPISNAQKQLDGLGTTAATFTTDFVAAIDAGMTPEKLANWQAAGQALGQLGDMSINMTAAIPQLTQTTWEMWNTQTNSVRGLISTFDGSVAATYALSTATKERYATEQALVNQISGAMTNLHTMFSSSNESMRLSVMTSQQKSNYFVDQANKWEAKLLTETDPAKIEEYARKYNDAQSNAWNNMDDTQRQAMLPSYLANNDSIDAYIQNKLGTTLDAITNTSGTELPAAYQERNQDLANRIADALRFAPLVDAMESSITNMSGNKGGAPQTPEQIAADLAAKQATEVNKESADKQSAAATSNTESASTIKAAADTLVAAAASLLAAANTPTKVDVVFNANVPGDSQLSVVPQ